MTDLASALKDARSRKGFSQTELAERAGVSQSMVSRIEQGARAPGVAVLAALAKALGVSLDSLAGTRRSGKRNAA